MQNNEFPFHQFVCDYCDFMCVGEDNVCSRFNQSVRDGISSLLVFFADE